ncbi:MAG: phosphate ABC transporter permease subunit PstC [Calditrichaeota bacterium]|nr:phosphate ABC transporter permease subunit PstC [Calditrichota bacterium]
MQHLIDKYKRNDNIFRQFTLSASGLVLILAAAILIVLFLESLTAIGEFGFINFIFSMDWDPYRQLFGAAPVIYGTFIVTVISLIMAIPVALGTAIYITQILSGYIKEIISISIELLAAIPSIIYGMWGLYVLAPIMGQYVEPFLQSVFGSVPGIRIFFEGTPIGIDILTASIVLSIMIIPFIASITREAFEQIPSILKESATALASTKWEVISSVLLKYIKPNIIGGIILAFGRALGETMAVAFVLGNRHDISFSLLDTTATITVTLANEFNEADGDLYFSSLYLLAFLLFLLSFSLLSFAKYLSRRNSLDASR